jgi:hypothetical protein
MFISITRYFVFAKPLNLLMCAWLRRDAHSPGQLALEGFNSECNTVRFATSFSREEQL